MGRCVALAILSGARLASARYTCCRGLSRNSQGTLNPDFEAARVVRDRSEDARQANSHAPRSTAATVRFREIPIPTSSRPLSCVAHETGDAPKRLKNPPSGTTKLSEVATQIQYLQVACRSRVMWSRGSLPTSSPSQEIRSLISAARTRQQARCLGRLEARLSG
jgi:hypothetical protein